MFGLDRACILVKLDADPELVAIGINKKFPGSAPKRAGPTDQSFKIDHENYKFINEIRVTEKVKGSIMKIDFSYPRFFKEHNLEPVTTEEKKQEVELEIARIASEISLESISREDLYYNYLEICSQEGVGGFFRFHNFIAFFYKALCRNYNSDKKSKYGNYSKSLDRFYETGFTFFIFKGFKLLLYSKRHEHKSKYDDDEVGGIIKFENKLTGNALKSVFGTNKVSDLSIQKLIYGIVEFSKQKLFGIIEDELERNHQILVSKLQNFNPRRLRALVKDLQEWALDVDCMNAAITEVIGDSKSSRQLKRYHKIAKESLRESQFLSSPLRDNFDNIKRLEFFLNEILMLDVKVVHSYKGRFSFNFN